MTPVNATVVDSIPVSIRTAVVLGGLMCAGPPESTESVRLGVLPVEFNDSAGPEVRRQLVKSVMTGLQRRGVPTIEPDAVLERAPSAAGCTTSDCIRQVGETLGARYLVRTRIEAHDRDYEVSLELLDPRSGEVLARAQEGCDVCGLNEAGELATLQAAALAQKLDMVADRPALLRLESAPPGATVEVDGEVVGTTPLEHRLPAGEHVLTVRKSGHLGVERTITSVGGVEERLSFDLPERSGGQRWRSVLAPVGWALFATGLATAGAGATLIAIDERPYQRDCNGENVDANGTCRFRYDTMTGGIVAVATAAALVGTGIGLVVHARRKGTGRRTKKAVEVQAGASPHGLWFRSTF